jgi:S-adenosylhomocysteine hydrolase
VRDQSKPLTPDELSHLVDIEAPAGTLAVDMTIVDTDVAAGIDSMSSQFQAREALAAGGIRLPSFATISMWYRTDIKASYVLVEKCHLQRRWQIQNLTPSNLGDAIDMVCVTEG